MSDDPKLAERYPLNVISPKSHGFLNSCYANEPHKIRGQGEQFVMISPTDAALRDIREGDPVIVDIGACYNGYWGDFTRTFICGDVRPTKEQIDLHQQSYNTLFSACAEAVCGLTAVVMCLSSLLTRRDLDQLGELFLHHARLHRQRRGVDVISAPFVSLLDEVARAAALSFGVGQTDLELRRGCYDARFLGFGAKARTHRCTEQTVLRDQRSGDLAERGATRKEIDESPDHARLRVLPRQQRLAAMAHDEREEEEDGEAEFHGDGGSCWAGSPNPAAVSVKGELGGTRRGPGQAIG